MLANALHGTLAGCSPLPIPIRENSRVYCCARDPGETESRPTSVPLCATQLPQHKKNKLFLLSAPLTPLALAKRTQAEGTEGEAESLLLRKLLKNQNRLIDSIRQMDADRDGVVSTDEFRAAVVAMDVGLTERQVEKLIASIDLDNNGELAMHVNDANAVSYLHTAPCHYATDAVTA